MSTAGKPWGDGVTEKLASHVVKEFATKTGMASLAPHDLRRTCARLCRAAGGELEQIQFLLGHVSVQTTERYLGCTQRIASAVNDLIGIERDVERCLWKGSRQSAQEQALVAASGFVGSYSGKRSSLPFDWAA